MLGLDDWIVGLAPGASPAVVLVVALVLGLRHASDPDHLVAVSTLVATEHERPWRRASRLGLAWGAGHGTTLVLLGIPIIVVNRYLPASPQRMAEALVGVVIAALAIRLLRRWRRGAFHVHQHEHDGVIHRHLHAHGAAPSAYEHEHRFVRSSPQSFAVGLVHGVGGSAGVGLLLLASIRDRGEALAALLLFASAAAVSMATLSLTAGYLLARRPVRRRFTTLVPGFGAVALVFGVWYALTATVQ